MPDLQQVRKWKLAAGGFLTDNDLKKQATVCLIGQTVRKELFGNNVNPIGEMVRIGEVQFQVIGVLEGKGRGLTGADQDDQVFIPLTTLQGKISKEVRIDVILAAARSTDDVDRAVQEITRALREQRRVKPGAEDFEVTNMHDILAAARLGRIHQIVQGIVRVLRELHLAKPTR